MTCTHCKTEKEQSEFYKNSKKSGFNQPCKRCISERSREKKRGKIDMYNPNDRPWYYAKERLWYQ